MDDFKDRLSKTREQRIREKQKRKMETALQQRRDAEFDRRVNILREKLWQVVKEVAKPTKLKTYRGECLMASDTKERWEHAEEFVIYDPKIKGSIDSIFGRRSYREVKGIVLHWDKHRIAINHEEWQNGLSGRIVDVSDDEIVAWARKDLQASVLSYVEHHHNST